MECYRKCCTLSNTHKSAPMQTYVKDMSASPLVVGTAATVTSVPCSAHKTEAPESTGQQPYQTRRVCALPTEGLRCIRQRLGSEANLLNGYLSRATPPQLGEQDCYTSHRQPPHCHQVQRPNTPFPQYFLSLYYHKTHLFSRLDLFPQPFYNRINPHERRFSNHDNHPLFCFNQSLQR